MPVERDEQKAAIWRRAAGQQCGFTLVELMIVVAVIAVLAAMTVPRLAEARIAANESAAIASLRTVHAAQASFAATCGGGGYAQSLDDLARPPMDGSAPYLVAPLNANGVVPTGYVANLIAGPGAVNVAAGADTCNGSAAATVSTYLAERHPVVAGFTGHRSFASDDSGTIYFRQDGATIVNLAGALPLN